MSGGVNALANTPVKTDGNGYLQVTIGGGTVTAMTITTLTTTKIIPPSDSTTAITLGNAAGTGLVVLDTTSGRVAIGKATAPSTTLDILEAANAGTGILVTNTTSGTAARAGVRVVGGTTEIDIFANSQGFTTAGRSVQGHGLIDTAYLDLSSSGANPIDFWSNGSKVASISTTGALSLNAKVASYNNIATAGQGVPSIYAAGNAVAQTAAATSICTFTPAADGDFEISGNVLVTTATTHAFTMTCAYTDEGGSARTKTLSFELVAGGALSTVVTAANGTVPYMGNVVHIRAKQTTAITVQTTGTFTTVVYNARAAIRQLQ